MALNDWRSRPRKPRPDLAARNVASAVHGMNGSPTWKSWCAMKQRCNNPKCKDYPNYGGRGIAVDPRWDTFDAFFADMGEKPAGLTLGRRDNDKGYGPGNCRWETPTEQTNNRRVSRFIEHDGRRQTVAEWAKELGCSRQTLRNRLEKGWPIANALQTKVSYANRRM